MDNTDRKILTLLQEDAAQPIADIARKVGLSVTPCWRRIQKLQEDGVIRARVALLDGAKVGFSMSVFVMRVHPMDALSGLRTSQVSTRYLAWWINRKK